MILVQKFHWSKNNIKKIMPVKLSNPNVLSNILQPSAESERIVEYLYKNSYSNRHKRINIHLFGLICTLSICILLLNLTACGGISGGTVIGGGSVIGGCNNTGVTKQLNRTYSFALLTTDKDGNVVDSNNQNCIIKLLGFNMGWADSGAVSGASSDELAAWKNVIPWNVMRIAINTRWWHDNVPVPTYNNTPFRTVIDSMVQLNKANGFYTELDMAEQFSEPPCGGNSGNSCTSQIQADTDFKKNCQSYIQNNDPQDCMPWAKFLNVYIPPDGSSSMGQQALTDLANLYGNDPSIIFDLWNEPVGANLINITEDQFFKQMNDRIQTITSLAPKSLSIVFAAFTPDIHAGKYSYPQHNIVMDYHIYDGTFDGNKFISNIISFDKSQHWGTVINEYGGTGGVPVNASEQSSLNNVVKSGGVGMLEWDSALLLNGNEKTLPYSLNPTGSLVCVTYAELFNQSSASCGSVPANFP